MRTFRAKDWLKPTLCKTVLPIRTEDRRKAGLLSLWAILTGCLPVSSKLFPEKQQTHEDTVIFLCEL